MQPFRARVAAVRDLTHDVRQIDLALVDPPQIRFVAGQFVSFEIDRSGFRTPATRPYSIASPPHEADRIELVLNRTRRAWIDLSVRSRRRGSDDLQRTGGQLLAARQPARRIVRRHRNRHRTDPLDAAFSRRPGLATSNHLVLGSPQRTRPLLSGRIDCPPAAAAESFGDDHPIATNRQLAWPRRARHAARYGGRHDHLESRGLSMRERRNDSRCAEPHAPEGTLPDLHGAVLFLNPLPAGDPAACGGGGVLTVRLIGDDTAGMAIGRSKSGHGRRVVDDQRYIGPATSTLKSGSTWFAHKSSRKRWCRGWTVVGRADGTAWRSSRVPVRGGMSITLTRVTD